MRVVYIRYVLVLFGRVGFDVYIVFYDDFFCNLVNIFKVFFSINNF